MSSTTLWPAEDNRPVRHIFPPKNVQGMAPSGGDTLGYQTTPTTALHRPRGASKPAIKESSTSPASQGDLQEGEDFMPSGGSPAFSPPSTSGRSSHQQSDNGASDGDCISRARMSATPELLAARPVSISRPPSVLQIGKSMAGNLNGRESLVATNREKEATSRVERRAGIIFSPEGSMKGDVVASRRVSHSPFECSTLENRPCFNENPEHMNPIGSSSSDSPGGPLADDGSTGNSAPARTEHRNSSHTIGGESYIAALKSMIMNPALTDFDKVGSTFEPPDVEKSTLKLTTFDVPEGLADPPPSRKFSRAKRLTRSTLDLRSIFYDHAVRDTTEVKARSSSTAPCIQDDLVFIDKEGLKALEEQLAHIKPPVTESPKIHYADVGDQDKLFIPKFATRTLTPFPMAMLDDENGDSPNEEEPAAEATEVASSSKTQPSGTRGKALRRMMHALTQAFRDIKSGCKRLARRKLV